MFSRASVRNTQPFILSEKLASNLVLTRRRGVFLCELAPFGLRNDKFGAATIQADNNLRGYPHRGLVNIFQSGEMDAHIRAEFLLFD